MKTMTKAFGAALLLAGSIAAGSALAQTTVTVGGAPMYSDKSIAQNAPNAKNLTTLVAAVKAAGLVETLAGPGPFTVFAPTDAAFAKLPAGTVEKLVQPDMKAQLTGILTYHVVAGKMTSADLMQQIKSMGGQETLKTVAGGTITVKMDGDKLAVTDESGHSANVETADVLQSNGVVHVIDSVLMPKM